MIPDRLKNIPHPISILAALVFVFMIVSALVKNWTPPESSSSMRPQKKSSTAEGEDLASHGFSATQVAADAYTEPQPDDFLTLLLTQHFPYSITVSDVLFLRRLADQDLLLPDTPSNHYKTGMCLFLLALAGSSQIADGSAKDAAPVSADWNQSIEQLRRARDLGEPLLSLIINITSAADYNHDRRLDAQELTSLITTHLYGKGA